MVKRTWAYVLIALISPFLGANLSSAQTLDEELVSLLKSHPLIKASREESASASEGTNKAFSAYYPTVNLSGDAGYDYVNNPTRRENNNPQDAAYGRGRETTTFTISQNLYNGGLDSASISDAEATENRSIVLVNRRTQAVLLEATDAYLGVLRARRLAENARKNESNIRSQYHLEDERVKLGSGVSVDVLESKRRLQAAKARVVELSAKQKNALATYQKVFNHPPDITRMKLPDIPLSLIPETLGEAVAVSQSENPDLKYSELTLAALKYRKRAAKSEYMPTFDLVFEHNYEKDKNTTIGIRRDWSLLLKANWALFSGFRTKASVSQAAHNYEAARGELENSKRLVLEKVKHAWEDRLFLAENLKLYENNVNLSTEVFNAKKRQREAGKETLFQVLDAEFSLYEARLALTAAKYDYVQASYKLLFAMGRLKASDIASSLNTVSSGG